MSSNSPPWIKTIHRLTAFAVVCIIAITALVFAYFGERTSAQANKRSADAAKQSLLTSQCVNRVLSLRNQPTTNDATAHIDFAVSLLSVFLAAPGDPQKQAVVAFEKVLAEYVKTLQADQQYRTNNPLGTC